MYIKLKEKDYAANLSNDALDLIKKEKHNIWKEKRFEKYVLCGPNVMPDDSKFNFQVIGYSLNAVSKFFDDAVKEEKFLNSDYEDEFMIPDVCEFEFDEDVNESNGDS